MRVHKDQLSKKRRSEPENPQQDELTDKIHPPSKKTPKWFFAVMVLLPVIIIAAVEIFLRVIDYGYNYDQWVDAGSGKYIINPEIGRRYFTSGDFNPNTIEDIFYQSKKPNSFRVFVLGESSAQGYPFNPMGSFSRYIRKRLELTYPNTTVEVVNISMTAINSYTMLDLLPGVIEQKPDLILIYAGHNEYYGALGVGSVQSLGSSRALIRSMLYLNKFKTTQLVRNIINWISKPFSSGKKQSSGTLMSRMAEDKYILLNSEKFNSGLQQFKDNLNDILQITKDKSIPVIIGRLVSNLKDQKPFISAATPGFSSAAEVYKKAVEEFKNKNYKKAESLFILAKDLDALRFRAPDKLNIIIEGLANQFHLPVVPVDSVFNSMSQGGIPGDNLIVDHLHPNLYGYQLIGKTFFDCMQRNGYLPKTENAAIPFNMQDSITRANFVFTKLDSVLGNNYIKLLKTDWPYTARKAEISSFKESDFAKLFEPKDFIDSLAMARIENQISWSDAHLIAATYYLRRDDIRDYLKHMNVLIYQYPNLKDLDGAIRFFYSQNKINLADYTPRRNGMIAMLIGNYQNAVRHLNEAYKSNPADVLVLYNLSLAYSEKQDFKKALQLVNECLVVQPSNTEAGALKREILKKLNN